MPETVTSTAILNIAAYKFVGLDDLHNRRRELRQLCDDLKLRGTIMLSPEGINLFVAGEEAAVRHLLANLREDPRLSDLEVKESYSESLPFSRMLVKLKREIIAFGLPSVRPQERTSPKISPEQLRSWLAQGRSVRLLDVRNDYEYELGTFENAEQLNIGHFRDFPAAVAQLPAEAKTQPLVMFCTGGIRCEKAGPMMEQAGFQEVYQLEGGILKYFEDCGGEFYQGSCFVFDGRVALDPQLRPTGALLCFACQAVVKPEDVDSPHYLFGQYCPKCYRTPAQQQAQSLAARQQKIAQAASPLPGSHPYDNMRPIHVPGRYHQWQLADFLDAWHPPTGKAQWLHWIAAGRITSAGINLSPEYLVSEGECLIHHMPDTIEPPVNPAIELLHEDEFLVVVNKPAPLPAHPSGRFNRNTLSHILGVAYRPEKLRVAHRLDAHTTGVVVLCRKHAASRYVQPQFARQTVDKSYLALVHGSPAWNNLICEAPISAQPGEAGSRAIDLAGKPSITEFRVLGRLGDQQTLIEAIPRSGRTNQIRIHLWHLGLPIVGDPLYRRDSQPADPPTSLTAGSGMCLHAWKLSLDHPGTKERVTYEAPAPTWAALPFA